jgi:prepilin-type N-terminal cleavage/methylation domain-containing protein
MIGDKQKGVTLIEMIIAASVFSIVFVASSSVFVSAVKIQRYNLNQSQLIDQTAYAIEYMARAIRMAQKDENEVCFNGEKNYDIIGDRSIEFMTYDGNCVRFFFDPGDPDAKQIKVQGDGFTVPLTSSRFEVTNFKVFEGTGGQPRITIFFEIKAKNLEDAPRVRLQTTVSQRNLND